MGRSKLNERRYEAVDPNPVSLPVKFQRPPTLAEQIARFMGAHQRFQEQQGSESPEEAEDFDVEDDESPYSPHELVYDSQLNRELPRFEKEHLDKQRAEFDRLLAQKAAQDRAARQAAESVSRQKMSEKNKAPSAPTDESDDE